METKYQVFVSSTYKDLLDERKKVIEILLTADCIPAGMEAFVATDKEQFSVIKRVIDLCDYYILIIGNRYGSVNDETGISYTEMEYDYAIEKGIPVLVFAKEGASDEYEETPENKAKLATFRSKTLKNRLASIWSDAGDLKGKVAIAIMKAKEDFVRPGWQRAQEYDELSLRKEIDSLRTKVEVLTCENQELKASLEDFASDTSDLAFGDDSITLEYSYYRGFDRIRDSVDSTWLDLFIAIALGMIYKPVTSSDIYVQVSNLVLRHHDVIFEDNNLITKITNQLEKLGLISHKEQNQQYVEYYLTKKGREIVDDNTLFRKKD